MSAIAETLAQCEIPCKRQMRRATCEEVETLARACHEANRALCLSRGDFSQAPWDEALPSEKDSAREGVRFHLEHQFASDRDSHDRWLERKLREGWKYGPVKDRSRQTHPCLLPFHALAPEDRMKDACFAAIVRGCANSLGIQGPPEVL